ncbi:MAG: radical SAM protein, partial [Nanoarchaeota archaeon]
DIKTGFLCNNNCLFCVQAHNKLKGNRELDLIKSDLVESRKRCEGVVLTGGEVTIRPDFLEIVRFAKDLNYKVIQIQTNARMFSNLDFCKKTILAGATEFSPALHGYNAKQHNDLTRAESFNQTLKAIINLKTLGAKVITNTVIVKQNYKDLPKIAELLVKLKVDQFQLAFIHAIGNAKENTLDLIPKFTEVIPYVKKALDIGIQGNLNVMVEAIPLCLMQEYEDFVSEKYIPDTEIKGLLQQNIGDYKKQRIELGKTKFPQCVDCKYDNICEGPWKEYPQYYGMEEFKPVK